MPVPYEVTFFEQQLLLGYRRLTPSEIPLFNFPEHIGQYLYVCIIFGDTPCNGQARGPVPTQLSLSNVMCL